MSSAIIEPKLGRVARTTKPHIADAITAGEFSVLVSDGFIAEEGGSRTTTAKKATRYGELYFFVSEDDAMEESAFLVGKRDGEQPEVAAARRARSTGGKTFKFNVSQLGRLGVGLVAGVVNSSGRRYGAGTANTTVPEVEAWAEALAAVDALKPSYLSAMVENFLYPKSDGTTELRRAKVTSVRQDGGVTLTVFNDQGEQDGSAALSAATALKFLGTPIDPLGTTVSGEDWPTISKIIKAIDPGSVQGPIGETEMQLRAVLRLLAAAGVAQAVDIATLSTATNIVASDMIIKWFSALHAMLGRLARRDASGAQSDGVEGLLRGAHAHRALGEQLNERHVALALQAALSSTAPPARLEVDRGGAANVTPRVLDLSGMGMGSSARPADRAVRFSAPAGAQDAAAMMTPQAFAEATALQGSAPQAAMAAAMAPAVTAPMMAPIAQVGAARRSDASGILSEHTRALVFFDAALSDGEFDVFLRNSSMYTLSVQMRQVLMADVPNARAPLAAALEAKLGDTECDPGMIKAVLGESRTSSQLLDTFRSMVDQARAVGGAASTRAPAATPVVVRVGDSAPSEGDDAPEAVALYRDVHEVSSSPSMRGQISSLASMQHDPNALFEVASGPATGAPLRRMLETLHDKILAKALAHHQMPDDLAQEIQQVRAALARRVLLGVFGSAAAEQTPQVKQCIAALRQGMLGRARPGLLIPGAGASTVEDPLGFLENMSDGTGQLAAALMHMQTALSTAFPKQAAATMRWFLFLQRRITEERGRGASWTLLSAWWAGVCKACDRRVDRVLQREVGVLLPLDQKVFDDPAAKYVADYHAARSIEMAEAAAQKREAAGDSLQTVVQREVAAALRGRKRGAGGGVDGAGGGSGGGGGGGGTPNGKKSKKRGSRSKTGGGSGTGGGGGGAGGGGGGGSAGGGGAGGGAGGAGGKGGGTNAGGGGGAALAIVDKSNGLSGRSVPDRTKYYKEGTEWNLTTICTALNADLGPKINGKSACPFYHVSEKGCKFSAAECKFYH